MKSGLTSITFRNKSINELAQCAKTAEVCAIEWGSDVHCPCTDSQKLNEALAKTKENGLYVSSYGSYFRLGISPVSEFNDFCKAAQTLETKVIRIWAFNKGPSDVTDEQYNRCIKEAQEISDIAKAYRIIVCFEYHRGTLTQDSQNALRLINDINRDNIRLYWQPNPDISTEQNCKELAEVLPYIENLHCFYWTKGDKRQALSDGICDWQKYLSIAKSHSISHALIEFVKDDSDESLYRDAEQLNKLLESI